MKKLICLLVLIMMVGGCAVTSDRIAAHINTYRRMSKKGYEIILDMSYREAFEMVIGIFRDSRHVLLKKDYKNKVILACGDKYIQYMMNTPVVFFEDIGENKTKLIIKGGNPLWTLNRIKEEAELRKNLDNE